MAQITEVLPKQFHDQFTCYLLFNKHRNPPPEEIDLLEKFVLMNFVRVGNSTFVMSQTQMTLNIGTPPIPISQEDVETVFSDYWDFKIRTPVADKGITLSGFIKFYMEKISRA